jgi:hypothetical protein
MRPLPRWLSIGLSTTAVQDASGQTVVRLPAGLTEIGIRKILQGDF